MMRVINGSGYCRDSRQIAAICAVLTMMTWNTALAKAERSHADKFKKTVNAYRSEM